MSEAQEKILAFDNQFFEFGTQIVEGVDCVSTPFPILDASENILNLKLTQGQFTELVSSIQIGAEWAYPDKSHQILFNFMKGLICSPEISAEDACTTYSPTSSFVHYSPNHPDSNVVPEGYILPAWYRFGEFDSIFPDWINDWLNDIITDFTGYEATDILCNIASFPANTIEAFLENGGILPSFEVHVNGQGTIKLELLSFPLGGRACIKLDSPPNLFDLLTGGILDPDTLYVDTVRDIFSFPPEEAVTNTVSIEVETLGEHVLYVVFVPLIDDSLAFLGLGGGIRSLELCGFEEVSDVGIESIVWEGCELKYVSGGIETVVATAADIQACLDLPEGGGGGGGGILPTVYDMVLGANITTTSVTFIHAAAMDKAHTFTKSKALVMAVFTAQNGGGQSSIFKLRLDTGSVVYGRDTIEARTFGGAENREIVITDVFEDIPAGSHTLGIEWRVTGNTGTIFDRYNLIWTIIEFDESSELGVQDIRVLENGDIQKMIGGVWITVTESLAAKLAAIQSTANSAQITANNALSTANGAVTVNSAQTVQINALQAGLGDANLAIADIDDRVASIETVDIPQINTTVANHETRLDALEAAGGGSGDWGGYALVAETDSGLALNPSTGRYSSATNSFETGATVGWRRRASDGKIFLTINDGHRFGSAYILRVGLTMDSYIGGDFQFRIDGGDWCNIPWQAGSTRLGWARIPNAGFMNMAIEIECSELANNWRLTGLVYLCTEPLPFS